MLDLTNPNAAKAFDSPKNKEDKKKEREEALQALKQTSASPTKGGGTDGNQPKKGKTKMVPQAEVQKQVARVKA